MIKLDLKYLATFVGIICMASTARAFDYPQSLQEYLDAVNSEALRIKPNSVTVKTHASESRKISRHNSSVEDMVVRLKNLSTHGRH